MPDWYRPYEGDQDDLHTLRYVVASGMSVAGLFPLCGLTMDVSGAGATAIVLTPFSRPPGRSKQLHQVW